MKLRSYPTYRRVNAAPNMTRIEIVSALCNLLVQYSIWRYYQIMLYHMCVTLFAWNIDSVFFFFIFWDNSLNILCTPSCLFFLVMTERIELSNCCDPRAKGRGKSFCNKLRRSTVRQKADHNPLIDFRFR